MARKIVEFEVFGLRLRTLQVGAVTAFAELGRESLPNPMQILSLIEIEVGGEWIKLNNRAAINAHVKEATGFVPAHVVLESVIDGWNEANMGFIKSWTPSKVPNHLKSDRDVRRSAGIDPIIASVINSKQATLRELEEYYSGEDAIKLFDINMNAKLDEAESQYQAYKEAKSQSGRR